MIPHGKLGEFLPKFRRDNEPFTLPEVLVSGKEIRDTVEEVGLQNRRRLTENNVRQTAEALIDHLEEGDDVVAHDSLTDVFHVLLHGFGDVTGISLSSPRTPTGMQVGEGAKKRHRLQEFSPLHPLGPGHLVAELETRVAAETEYHLDHSIASSQIAEEDV